MAELFGDLGELIKRNVQLKLLPTIEIFQRLSEAEIAVLVDSSIDENFKAGDTIMRQGDKKSRVYVIKDGKVNLTAGRNEELGTGDYFGEEAFESSDAEYSCTVVAADATTLLSIDCNQFKNSATVQIADALRTAMASAPPNARRSQRVAAMPEMSDLNVTTLIGVGSFGRVRLALDERAGEYYALKCMNKGLVVAKKQVTHVSNEKGILSMCHHPFLVNLVGWYQNETDLFMLFELLQGGELFSIMSKGIFTEATCRFYCANVTSAFEYLHERKIAYRDLKPENLLLDAKGYLKVADFGFAKIVQDRTWTLCGTPDYLAPEIITRKGHNCAVDWWAVGVFLYELLTGFPPFTADEQVETFKRILSAQLTYPSFISEAGVSLLSNLLTINPDQRLGNGGGREVREHSFFKSVDFVKLVSRQLPTPYVPAIRNPGDISNYDHFDEPNLSAYDKHNTNDEETFGFWDDAGSFSFSGHSRSRGRAE